ncbi:DoxX family protein [Pseudonocardia sp. CA-107938]|uniref:DoxX family protein n=1 Tax=Pseudonocardia sp. CA-107938 TaxID=3240021 RepID=UPI003D8F8754
MEPLIVLVAVTALLTVAGRPPALALRYGLAAMFPLTGGAHFIGLREELIAMVPPWLPAPDLLVTVTGVLELLGAVGLVLKRTAPWAAAGLTGLLLAMFPANVQHALSGTELPWHDQLVPRTLMQVLFLAATVAVVVLEVRSRRAVGAAQGAPAVVS